MRPLSGRKERITKNRTLDQTRVDKDHIPAGLLFVLELQSEMKISPVSNLEPS